MEKEFIKIAPPGVGLSFLYRTALGRACLKTLSGRTLSRICGAYLDSRYSTWLIPGFVKKNKIDLSDYKVEMYRSFNDCFARHIREEVRPVCQDETKLIAPCDGLLSVYPIHGGSVIPVKQAKYSIERLLDNKELAKRYERGICLVYRLCVDHYHRYGYVESGEKSRNIFLPGKLHTVRPIALEEGPVFTENCREYTLIQTKNFHTVLQMEVGAMLVGKIVNEHQEKVVTRGEEKGHFAYGGSTIIVLLQKDTVKILDGYEQATRDGYEIPVRMGEVVGEMCTQKQ